MVRALSLSEYPTMSGEKFRFTVFRLVENAFVNPPSPDMIRSSGPPCRTPPLNLLKESLSPHEKIFLEKSTPYSRGRPCKHTFFNVYLTIFCTLDIPG